MTASRAGGTPAARGQGTPLLPLTSLPPSLPPSSRPVPPPPFVDRAEAPYLSDTRHFYLPPFPMWMPLFLPSYRSSGLSPFPPPLPPFPSSFPPFLPPYPSSFPILFPTCWVERLSRLGQGPRASGISRPRDGRSGGAGPGSTTPRSRGRTRGREGWREGGWHGC